MSQRPMAVGLLLCEQVIVEEKTRNVTPVNCFTTRTVLDFPSELAPFVVFAVLTNGDGPVSLVVFIERLDSWEEVYRMGTLYRFPGPLHEVRFLLRVRNCSVPVAGWYQAALIADGEMVAQKKFRVVQKEVLP